MLPQTGPLQTEEVLLTDAYVHDNLYSRLSSRHFRNQIDRNRDGFREFKRLAENTWHGLRVHPIDRKNTRDGTVLSMLVQDGDFVAEVGWMGHGLQMWLQTIWFISRTPTDATIVLDEPDVYMHPDLQRKLFRLVRARFTQSIIATHSVEIMAEAEPANILVIDKSKQRSRYASSDPGVQALIDQIGGMHNVHLARLWNAKKFLLVEGKDLSILRQFHALLYPDAEAQLDAVPNMQIGGWGGWHYAVGSAMTLENALGDRVITYCILDPDYHTPKQISRRYGEATDRGIHLHIWAYKELENYLLNPAVIQRVVGTRTQAGGAPSADEVRQQMLTICEDEKDTIIDGIAAELIADDRSLGTGANKLARETVRSMWSDEATRLRLVSGKEVLARLSEWAKTNYGVSFGPVAVLRQFRVAEVPAEMSMVLEAFECCGPFPSDTNAAQPRGVAAASPERRPVALGPAPGKRITEKI